MSQQDLKPCPFGCGDTGIWDRAEMGVYMNKPSRFKVGCRKASCLAYIKAQHITFETPDKATEAWNRRATAPGETTRASSAVDKSIELCRCGFPRYQHTAPDYHCPLLGKHFTIGEWNARTSRPTPTGELKTVAWAVTCNGDITRNIYTSLSEAESCLLSLNTTHPKDKREVVEVVRKSDALAHNEAVRGAMAPIQAYIAAREGQFKQLGDDVHAVSGKNGEAAITMTDLRRLAALLASQGEIVREDKK